MAKENWKAIKANPKGKEAREYYKKQREDAMKVVTSSKGYSLKEKQKQASILKSIASKGHDRENIRTAVKVGEEYKSGNKKYGETQRKIYESDMSKNIKNPPWKAMNPAKAADTLWKLYKHKDIPELRKMVEKKGKKK